MKKNKLLIVIILLGFLSFGMSYSSLIKENFVAPLVKKLAESEKKSVNTISTDKITKNKSNTFPAKEKSIDKTVVAATISLTNAVAVNGGGNALPGSQLDFTLTLTNTGIDDATGTTFQDILDSNLTLVPGSLKATPIAANDTYNCIGNVGITLNAAQGILSNDASPDGTPLSAVVLANPTHGTVSLSANGSFTYNPTAGYSGTDSFTYTLTSGSGKTGTGTVNIIISAPIFFVNSSVATNGNGTLASPFKTLDNATGTGSNPIFIYTGTGSSGTTLTLSANQKLVGQGATASLISILNIVVPTYSNALPSTGGTNPTFSVLNINSNNDIEGITLSGTNATIAGSNVGTLKVRDASINGGSAVAVNISSGGALDCIFKSISANGAPKGISVNNSTGSFQVTGTGTTAGSGGTIQNITNRGAEFISCSNISLKNMNFTNSTTSSAICSSPAVDNSSCNGSIHLKAVTGVTLDNISITGTNNAVGININNVTNFALSNSTLTNCGSNTTGSDVGGIYALNLGGTSSITNTNINDSWGRGFYAYNGILSQNPTLNMTVTGCQFKNSFNKANGGSNFIFQGYGSSSTTLTLKGNDFSNAKEYGLQLNFGGTSINTIQVGGNIITEGNTINAATISPGSNGLSLQAVSAATVNYNVINNIIKSSFSAGFTCNIGNQGTGTMKGRINSNIIDGAGIGSSCNGISVAAYEKTKHITEIKNNTITNVSTYGIVSESNDNNITNGNARMDATIQNNTINLVTNGYAHLAVISVAFSPSSTLISAANVGNNTTNSPVTGLGAATFDVLSQGANSQVILQGPTTPYSSGSGDRTAALTTYWNANNGAGPRTAIDEQGGGTIVPGIVLIPDNSLASKMAPPVNIEETPLITEAQNTNNLTNKPATQNSTAKNASGETISAGPFTLPAGKSTVITFSATINAANTLPANTCSVTNQASVSGSNFATVNSNITTTSIKPANATVTTDTQNITCLGSTTVTLNATCPLATTATWYTSLTGGTSFATGSSVTATPTVNNTTYCVACETAYCASDRVLVKTVTGTPSTSSTQTVTACGTYTWAEDGNTYTTSGTYTHTVGCDTKTLNLTITPPTSSAQTVSVCDTYTWAEDGNTYTTSGTYTHTVGCDTKTLNLTITPSTSSAQTVSVCDTYTWAEDGNTYTTSGTYTHTVGCNTKTLNLTINNSSAIDNTVSLNSGLLTSNHLGATYQWYKCPNTLLTNETNQSYTPLTVGDYKVEITVGNCTVTSNCITVSSLAVEQFNQNEFKIYPNPSKGTVNIVTSYEGNYIIIDQSGKKIKSVNLDENVVNTIHLENVSDGIYIIKSISDSKVKAQKFFIKK
ncbi:beta strand repeat-containing protein [Flavobacterium chilense]|uniref:beta strand repeat-containing protein n=1 Tax=Flavobacterium chilense TaxID=946677 RepID=UPI00083A153A|nr:Ig-like domain-containing protein [Flavobacterium chilense]